MWEVFNSIRDLPVGLWDEKIARGSVSLDSRLIELCETSCREDAFRYFLCRDTQKELIGIFFVMLTRVHPLSFAGIRNARINRVGFRAAVSATPETSGAHFWFDPVAFTPESFIKSVYQEINSLPDRFSIILFRDFFSEETAIFRNILDKMGFISAEGLTVTRILISEDIHAPEDYQKTLSGKQRYDWRRYVKNLDPVRYRIEVPESYELSEIYPLYLQVNQRAHEWRSVPRKISYFSDLTKIYGKDAEMLMIREVSTGKCLGWMLILFFCKQSYLIYIGFSKISTLTLWHNLLIASIEHSVSKGVKVVDLGVTHESAKKRFGARGLPVRYFYRFRNLWLNVLMPGWVKF